MHWFSTFSLMAKKYQLLALAMEILSQVKHISLVVSLSLIKSEILEKSCTQQQRDEWCLTTHRNLLDHEGSKSQHLTNDKGQ